MGSNAASLSSEIPALERSIVIMDVSVSAATFSSFLKCRRKGYFLSRNIPAPSALFSDIEARLFALYKAEATDRQGGRQTANFWDVARGSIATVHGIDCATAVYHFCGQASRCDVACERSSTDNQGPIPVVFSPWDKPELIDSLLVCFGAIALAQVSDIWVSAGMLIYGTGYRRKLVKTEQHFPRVYPVLEAIRKVHEAGVAPPVVLNRHCSTCDFQPQCRQLAIDQDDLPTASVPMRSCAGPAKRKPAYAGTFAYKATATDAQGQTATWEPFKRVTSQLQVARSKSKSPDTRLRSWSG